MTKRMKADEWSRAYRDFGLPLLSLTFYERESELTDEPLQPTLGQVYAALLHVAQSVAILYAAQVYRGVSGTDHVLTQSNRLDKILGEVRKEVRKARQAQEAKEKKGAT